jgi:hypothetical protein
VLAAWIVTGPLGHLYAGVADWGGVLVAYLRARGRTERMYGASGESGESESRASQRSTI